MKKAIIKASGEECNRCGDDAKTRARDFSDQAVATLIAHKELTPASVGEAICDPCYSELRDILIEISQHNSLEISAKSNILDKNLKRAG